MERNINIEKHYKLTDIQAYIKFHNFNFIYNKLDLIKSQLIPCAPVGIYPTRYPIVIKPIINLFGMSRDITKINNDNEYEIYLRKKPSPSNFWMPYLEGNHYTIDLFLLDGEIIYSNTFQSFSKNDNREKKYSTHVKNKKNYIGIFKEHRYIKSYVLSSRVQKFLSSYLKNYTGCVNIEIINDIIIEMHLRWNGDNYIYREHSRLFNFLHTKIELYKKKRQRKTYIYRFPFTTCFYIPLFIYKKREKEKNQLIIDEYNHILLKQTNNRLNIYYDDLSSIKQQMIKRYCVIVFYNEKEKYNFLRYLYKNGC